MDWIKLLCTDRPGGHASTPGGGDRSEYQRDHDRIVFSDAFRRLQRKTQVHPMPSNDHVHNRLTHSLEVSCVGRSLGETAGSRLARRGLLPEGIRPADLGTVVQASCLVHDIGNPPFGHAGEYAIRDWYAGAGARWLSGLSEAEKNDLTVFEGNAQGFRIATALEYNRFDGGMRLTCATLATFCKYPWGSDQPEARGADGKFGIFRSEMPLFRQVAERAGLIAQGKDRWCRHPLTWLVEAADDICYALIDIEDGIELSIVRIQDLESVLSGVLSQDTMDHYRKRPFHNDRERVAWLRGKAMDILVDAVIEAFMGNYDSIMRGEFRGDLVSACREDVRRCLEISKRDIARGKIFRYGPKMVAEIGAYAAMGTLLAACGDAVLELQRHRDTGSLPYRARRILDLMGVNAPVPQDSPYHSFLKVNDFVSGLTDERLSLLVRQLNGTGV
ncbi:MAG: deoxyguanosinetriphosphate triphosphohydrolase [Pseudomonadota bacterium]|nr:deoxyguanosinetriphosphate triphosphohydrolase [Pseudomonadota bacterium]